MARKALNKLFVIIDTKAEQEHGFNKAFESKIYQNSAQPKTRCAELNRTNNDAYGISDRYQVAEIVLSETSVISRKTYINRKIQKKYNGEVITGMITEEI